VPGYNRPSDTLALLLERFQELQQRVTRLEAGGRGTQAVDAGSKLLVRGGVMLVTDSGGQTRFATGGGDDSSAPPWPDPQHRPILQIRRPGGASAPPIFVMYERQPDANTPLWMFVDAAGNPVLGESPTGLGLWARLDFAPVGSVQYFAGSSAPSTWAICDGAEISRAEYSELFGLVGTSFGSGNGTSTFNLPNLLASTPSGLIPIIKVRRYG
jgi:hypothetical protein